MQPELPPDDDDQELLDKVDALLKKHQPRRYAAPPEPTAPPEYTAPPEPPPAAITEPQDADGDGIPVLTDIVDQPADAPAPASDGMSSPDKLLLDLEDRLYRELEAHIAPQLSMAFGKALNELLSQARIHIGTAVREHLAHELPNRPHAAPQHPGDESLPG